MSLKIDKSRTVHFYTDDDATAGITELQVCESNAGYYVGRMCDDGPYSRESAYYNTRRQAKLALDTKEYSR